MTHKQKVLALLSDGRPHGHMELYRLGCIAHSRIADLRRDGHVIECERTEAGYSYRLVSSPLDGADTATDGGLSPVSAPSSCGDPPGEPFPQLALVVPFPGQLRLVPDGGWAA
jgi:hypothetical protein